MRQHAAMANTKRKPRVATSRSRIRVPKRTELAAPPGTLPVTPESPLPVRATALVYCPDACSELVVRTVDNVADVRKPNHVAWIDVEGVTDATLIKRLGAEFGWHALALEDVVSLHQRPKAEDFGGYAYVVVYMPSGQTGLHLEQLSILFGPGYVATVQGGTEGDCLAPVRRRITEARGKVRSKGSDYLAYAIIDAVIDHYFPVVDGLNTRLETLEQEVLTSRATAIITEVPAIRSDLHLLWRTLAATREAIEALLGDETTLVAAETHVYLRDCADHCAQLLDAVEACRELSANLLDLHQAIVNNRTGESMRVLTLIATIFMPLSFIAGLYGMNFDREASPWNMPELGWYAGYPMVLGLMACTAIGLTVFFWRSGWLGAGPRNK
jgi:magnesium transporter